MVKFLLRLPDDLHSALKQLSKRSKRSLHSEILFALEFYLTNNPSSQYDATPKLVEDNKPKKKR